MGKRKKIELNTLQSELRWLFFISLGVFLFILFFQPFPLKWLDYNNRLLYVSGFWGITLILSVFVLMVLPYLFPKWLVIGEWERKLPFILYILLFIFTATAYTFYVRYVGKTPVDLYILVKISLVCLLPVIILSIVYNKVNLEHQIIILKKQNAEFGELIKEYEIKQGENELVLFSANKAEKISIQTKNIILIKSADNYIEISYLDNDELKCRLIRNTLKDIEVQLEAQNHIIRCHRTCLLNANYLLKLNRNYNGYTLKLRYIDYVIPVSRQYLTLVKDSISPSIQSNFATH